MNDDNDYPFNKRKILKFNCIKFNNNNSIKSNIKLIQVIRHQVLAQLQSQLINYRKCCCYSQKLKTKSSLNQVESSLNQV